MKKKNILFKSSDRNAKKNYSNFKHLKNINVKNWTIKNGYTFFFLLVTQVCKTNLSPFLYEKDVIFFISIFFQVHNLFWLTSKNAPHPLKNNRFFFAPKDVQCPETNEKINFQIFTHFSFKIWSILYRKLLIFDDFSRYLEKYKSEKSQN